MDEALVLAALANQGGGGGGGEPSAYIKSVAASGNTATFTKQDDTTVQFTPQVVSNVVNNIAISGSDSEYAVFYRSLPNGKCNFADIITAEQAFTLCNEAPIMWFPDRTADRYGNDYHVLNYQGSYWIRPVYGEQYDYKVFRANDIGVANSNGEWHEDIIVRLYRHTYTDTETQQEVTEYGSDWNPNIDNAEHIPITDTGSYFSSTNVEGALQEVGDALEDIPSAYIKSASVSGNTLTLTKQDDTTVQFTPQGGSSDIVFHNIQATTTDYGLTWTVTTQIPGLFNLIHSEIAAGKIPVVIARTAVLYNGVEVLASYNTISSFAVDYGTHCYLGSIIMLDGQMIQLKIFGTEATGGARIELYYGPIDPQPAGNTLCDESIATADWEEDHGEYYYGLNRLYSGLSDGEELKVTWNGTEYECTVMENTGYWYITQSGVFSITFSNDYDEARSSIIAYSNDAVTVKVEKTT